MSGPPMGRWPGLTGLASVPEGYRGPEITQPLSDFP